MGLKQLRMCRELEVQFLTLLGEEAGEGNREIKAEKQQLDHRGVYRLHSGVRTLFSMS